MTPLRPLADAPIQITSVQSARVPVPAIAPPLKTFVILEGDPGQNRGPGQMYNTGALFHLAALTIRTS